MKNKTVGRILFAVFAVALCAAAYFAADLAFFQYDDPLERATLSVVNDGEALSFTYDNDAITLHGGDNTTVYALTMGGTAVVEDTYSESFPSDFSGSFAAVQTGIREDTDGDGVKEDITRIAKTDMEYTQGYDATANAFLSEDIPLEVVYKDREKFTVYYLAKPVKNAEITVTLADGSEQVFTTDESGDITGLNLNDVRNGLTFTYRPNPLTTLSIHYQVEADTIFTARWLSAMLPFGIIILISAVCITLDVFLRKLLYKNEKLPIGKTGIMAPLDHHDSQLRAADLWQPTDRNRVLQRPASHFRLSLQPRPADKLGLLYAQPPRRTRQLMERNPRLFRNLFGLRRSSRQGALRLCLSARLHSGRCP